MRHLISFLLLFGLGTAPAAAQTVLHLSATGTVQALADQVTASLTAQANARTAAQAQDKVNQAMKAALTAAKATQGVAATTDGYNVQDTSEKQNGTEFQASQTLDLTAPAPDGLPQPPFLNLVGQLQANNLQLNGLDGGLSDAGNAHAQAQAVRQAIGALQAQAADTANTLGETVGPIRSLSIDSAPREFPAPMMMKMAAPAAATPPQSAPGPVTITATVTAEVDLNVAK